MVGNLVNSNGNLRFYTRFSSNSDCACVLRGLICVRYNMLLNCSIMMESSPHQSEECHYHYSKGFDIICESKEYKLLFSINDTVSYITGVTAVECQIAVQHYPQSIYHCLGHAYPTPKYANILSSFLFLFESQFFWIFYYFILLLKTPPTLISVHFASVICVNI